MARSIGEWFADHAHYEFDGSSDDEVVERQAPWDLQSPGMATTCSARRDAGASRKSAGTSSSRGRKGRVAGPAAAAGRAIMGSGLTKSESTAVGRQLPSPAGVNMARGERVPRALASHIRRAAHAHPHVGHKKIAALLRARGTEVAKAQVAEVLRRRYAKRPGNRSSEEAGKPARVLKLTAGAQTSRTVHETPLCQSCGVRLSIYATCRCS